MPQIVPKNDANKHDAPFIESSIFLMHHQSDFIETGRVHALVQMATSNTRIADPYWRFIVNNYWNDPYVYNNIVNHANFS